MKEIDKFDYKFKTSAQKKIPITNKIDRQEIYLQYVFQKKRLIDLIHKECLQINKKDEHYNRKTNKEEELAIHE